MCLQSYMKIIIIILFLLASFTSSSHPLLYENFCIVESQDDLKAQVILDKVKDKYFAHNDITISFTLHIHLADRPKTQEKGQIVQQGEKFKVNMKDQDIYCNGDDLWYHLKDKNEVQINDYEGGEDLGVVSPADLLRQYESGEFEYALHKEYVAKEKRIAEIEFKPNDEFSDYSKIRVAIDTEASLIKEVWAFGKDGSRFNMKIDSEVYDQDYSDSYFEFDATRFPDVIVEDLRLD